MWVQVPVTMNRLLGKTQISHQIIHTLLAAIGPSTAHQGPGRQPSGCRLLGKSGSGECPYKVGRTSPAGLLRSFWSSISCPPTSTCSGSTFLAMAFQCLSLIWALTRMNTIDEETEWTWGDIQDRGHLCNRLRNCRHLACPKVELDKTTNVWSPFMLMHTETRQCYTNHLMTIPNSGWVVYSLSQPNDNTKARATTHVLLI